MKLHQLTIENIASIEHAVIDFNKAPLKDERLFLITGETGSGKSTIIDCLCLALYGNTPRMDSARGAKYENAHTDSEKKDELTTNTPKQLMRRGSVRASVELTFEDNAGIPYIASWEVHRAHGKADGRISEISRCLRTADGVTPAKSYTKVDDIKDHIRTIIGLTMSEFFRTVVLAQGKFAEFLNSDDNEKSDLLEKMTGTGIYTQLGKKIYEVCQKKQDTCKILRGQMENITTLSEDQKAKINDEMGELRRNQETVDGQLKQATAMAQWLSRKGQIDKEIAEQSKLLEDKQSESRTDAHQAQEALVKDWDTTADARHHLKESDKASARISELEREQAGLQEEFDRLCGALRAANADIDTKQKKADEMGEILSREAPNRPMYDAIGQIVTLFNQWREKRKNITDYTSDLEKDKKRLPDARKTVEVTKAKCKQTEETVKQLKQQQGGFDIAGISARIDALNHAYHALVTLKDKHDTVAQADAVLVELKHNQAEEKSNLEVIKATIGEKRVRKEELQKQLERVTDWNQLLIQAQKTLHEGDSCPVCGNRITKLLVPKAESELEEMRALLEQADDALQQTVTQVKTSENLILNYENRINKAKQDLLKRQAERDAHWNDTDKLLANCGKKADEMADNAVADALIHEIEGQVAQLNEQLKKASELTRQVQVAQQQLDEANRALHKAEMQYNTIQESIKHQGEVIQNSKKEAEDLFAQLDKLFVIDGWQARADEEFIKQLQSAADDYRALEKSRQQLSQHIEVHRAAIPAMLKTKEGIKGLKDNGMTADQAPNDLEECWRRFGNRHVQWSTQLDSARDNATAAKKALDEYCRSHPDITMERLAELNSHTQAEIDGIKLSHQALSNAVITLKGAIDTLTKQQEDLKAKKPDFIEENPERLDEFIAQKQGVLSALTTQIADLKAQLNADEEKARLVKDKADLLKKADAEFEQWNQFNNMLGSADGTKFRRIAQSYILGDLLAKANSYLCQFNNRYELEAYPGTLTILVRDLVQGDLTSSTTLSGGESFMVSLALALALSNMTGRVFSVDTIFIDEGFGSLSEEYLEKVMETLNRLYDMGGRRVGIISHVEVLKKRVPTQIQVFRDKENTTVSRIEVVEGVMS